MKSVVVLMCLLGVSLCLPVQEKLHREAGPSSAEVLKKLHREARSSSGERYRMPPMFYPPPPPYIPPYVPPAFMPPQPPVSPTLSLLELLALLLPA
ncbi:lysine-specific demethylase 6B-like [Polypterus senegalus]|uniref:Secretory calcium-binding phosphoprotein 3b n=1 Tax=Polypterus senegalus TaxID=55291 RepID=A0A250DUJ6_POLSE|nr:lysine-specific demethylase 6B-like [Polypterus senegalus]ATA58048.1 secretory calcium-binding phosphoprotein 3b [Polypterus senegalus]